MSYPFRGRSVKCPFIGKALVSGEEHRILHPGKKYRDLKSLRLETRGRKEQRDTARCTERGLSLISGRLEQEIRPQGKAVYLAYLRFPVIIIKAVFPTATAEQSSLLERHPVRRKINRWSKIRRLYQV